MSKTSGRGFILSRRAKDLGERCVIELWLATDNGPLKLTSEPQRPVLFVEDHKGLETRLRQAGIACDVTAVPLKTFTHRDVYAVYCHCQGDFYRLRDWLRDWGITQYEGDIRPAERFLMERFVTAGVRFQGVARGEGQLTEGKIRPDADYHPHLRVLSLDIECSAKGALFSVGLAAVDYQNVLMIGPASEQAPDYIHWVKDERALLLALEQAIADYDPDVIIGWAVVSFDFKLLIKRAEGLAMPLRLGRQRTPVSWREGPDGQGFVNIEGRVIIDGIDALKTATYQFDSFSLENVAQALLGRGKDTEDVDNRLAQIEQDFIHNKVALARYNLNDCQLVLEIFEHTKLLDFLTLRSQLTGLGLDRSGGSVAAFLHLYLPRLHRAGYVAPNRPRDGGLASPGGYVMTSRPGLYDHVLVLDFKSLYPSIIRTFKIDPLGLTEGLAAPEHAIPGFKGAVFSRDKHFLPAIIESLWQQRDEAKRNQDHARSQAIKILMNSFYGVLGSGGCPFYDPRLASSITLRGHEIMQTTAEWIKQAGYQVIYGDTDSTFVWLPDVNGANEARAIGQRLKDSINLRWQDKLQQQFNLPCHLEIEFETHFSRFLMPTIRGTEVGSKKRYAGLAEHNGSTKLVFKGLETVRSDWTALAKQFQTELYRLVFARQDPSGFVCDFIRATRAGEHDHLMIYAKRLRRGLASYQKNVPPHVRAAKLADAHQQRLGKTREYRRPGVIRYVQTLKGPEPVAYQRHPLDYEHYIERQLQPVAEAILPFVDLEFETLVGDQIRLF